MYNIALYYNASCTFFPIAFRPLFLYNDMNLKLISSTKYTHAIIKRTWWFQIFIILNIFCHRYVGIYNLFWIKTVRDMIKKSQV